MIGRELQPRGHDLTPGAVRRGDDEGVAVDVRRSSAVRRILHLPVRSQIVRRDLPCRATVDRKLPDLDGCGGASRIRSDPPSGDQTGS